MQGSDSDGPRPRRRSVLLGLLGAAAGGGLLSGCTGGGGRQARSTPTPTPPSPDQLAAGRAVLAARALLAGEALLPVARPGLGPIVAVLAVQHRAHLAALGASADGAAPVPSGPSTDAAPGASTAAPVTAGPATNTSGTSTSPGTPKATHAGPTTATTPVAMVAAERAAAEQALADVEITDPSTAGLLAQIAASRFVNADLLASAAKLPVPADPTVPAPAATTAAATTAATPTPSPTASPSAGGSSASALSPSTGAVLSPSTGVVLGPPASPTGTSLDPTAITALSQLLSGEHAAVFAYGLITARVPHSQQPAAQALWDSHRARRDELEQRLAAAGATPPAALAAYNVGPVPVTAAQLAVLGARVEDGMAAVALSAVITATGEVRMEAATDLIRAARRATGWRGTPQPLPG